MRKCLCILVLIVSSFLFSKEAVADERIKEVGKTEEGTFIYSFEDYGTFTTNLEEGKISEVGYLEWDDSLTVSISKDGKNVALDESGLIFENGNYLLLIFSKTGNEYATFSFSIENELGVTQEETKAEEKSEVEGKEPEKDDLSDAFSSFDFSTLEDMLNVNDESQYEVGKIDCDYSDELKAFETSYNGENLIVSDIPEGAITSKEVYVKPVKGISAYLYLNGEMELVDSSGVYSEPGKYDILVFKSKPGEGMAELHFTFEIVPKMVNDIEQIVAPDGYIISKATYNGGELNFDKQSVLIGEDGEYRLFFVSRKNKDVGYELSFIKDTKAPEIMFSKDVSNGSVKAPLSYSFDEKDGTIEVIRDGERLNIPANKDIYNGGNYVFLITDEAGNVGEYSFFLKTKYVFSYKEFFIYFGILAFFVLIYVFFLKKTDNYGVK